MRSAVASFKRLNDLARAKVLRSGTLGFRLQVDYREFSGHWMVLGRASRTEIAVALFGKGVSTPIDHIRRSSATKCAAHQAWP